MRVVMVSKALVVGAYQRKLEELARQPGIELIAVVPPGWRDRRGAVRMERAHTQGYELCVAPLVFSGQYHLHFYPTAGVLLRRLRPDVLHVDEEPYNLATWHLLRIGQAIGARGVFFTWQNLHRRYPWPFRHFEQANYRRAAHAIAGSEAAAAVLRDKGYRGPISVIPQFGVDPAIFSPASERTGDREQGMEPAGPGSISNPLPSAASPSAPSFVIGYAGGLVPEKGADMLLCACAALPCPDWTLLILGDGPERARLADLAARELPAVQGRVHFLKHLPSTAMPGFYRQLDVLVLPSRSCANWTEQFGRVLIEAMACGVPVAGSSCGEIPNVVGDAGIIFPEGDVNALSQVLAALAADRSRRAELSAQGRARVLARYTQARIATETAGVYRQLMGADAGAAS